MSVFKFYVNPELPFRAHGDAWDEFISGSAWCCEGSHATPQAAAECLARRMTEVAMRYGWPDE